MSKRVCPHYLKVLREVTADTNSFVYISLDQRQSYDHTALWRRLGYAVFVLVGYVNNLKKSLSHLLLMFSCSVVSYSFATPWTVAHKAPLSTGFPRQENWSELLFLSLADLWPRDRTHISCIGRWVLYLWATKEALSQLYYNFFKKSSYQEERENGLGKRNFVQTHAEAILLLTFIYLQFSFILIIQYTVTSVVSDSLWSYGP